MKGAEGSIDWGTDKDWGDVDLCQVQLSAIMCVVFTTRGGGGMDSSALAQMVCW